MAVQQHEARDDGLARQIYPPAAARKRNLAGCSHPTDRSVLHQERRLFDRSPSRPINQSGALEQRRRRGTLSRFREGVKDTHDDTDGECGLPGHSCIPHRLTVRSSIVLKITCSTKRPNRITVRSPAKTSGISSWFLCS